MTTLGIASSAYGNRYVPFLGAHVEAMTRVYPDVRPLVVYDDIEPGIINAFREAYRGVEFHAFAGGVGGTKVQRIGRKLRAWQHAGQILAERTDSIAFFDVDTVLVRPVDDFVDAADVVFTWKNEPISINTGVVLLRSAAAPLFLDEWMRRTETLLCDLRATDESVIASGAPDQHTFRELIGWINYDGTRTREVAGADLTMRGVECRLLNETNSAPITDDTRVIHFKSGWHRILIEGGDFHGTRTEKDSAEMYAYWLDLTQTWRAKVDAVAPGTTAAIDETIRLSSVKRRGQVARTVRDMAREGGPRSALRYVATRAAVSI